MAAVELLILVSLIGGGSEVTTYGEHREACGEPALEGHANTVVSAELLEFQAPGRFTANLSNDHESSDQARVYGAEVVLAGIADCSTSEECGFLVGAIWSLIRKGRRMTVTLANSEPLARQPQPIPTIMGVPDREIDDLAYFLLRNGYAMYDDSTASTLGGYRRCRLQEAQRLAQSEGRGRWEAG